MRIISIVYYKGRLLMFLCLALILSTFILSSPLQQPATSESRGREIYVRGLDPSGREIKATLGPDGAELTASVVPCSSCHGFDGRGKSEGGVVPTSIRWPDLTRPYEIIAPSGRKHPAYTESLLVRAVTMGIDSGGNSLDSTMPRYQLSQQNARDLVAWLQKLGADDPGVTDTSIEIGVFFSGEPAFSELNSASKKVMDAYFDDVNRSGGVYGRRITLRYGEIATSHASLDEALTEFLKNNAPFALLNSYIAGSEDAAGKILEGAGVPLLGAVTLYPNLHDPLNRYIFYLNSGVPGQAAALAEFAERNLPPGEGIRMVLCDGRDPARTVADDISRHRKIAWQLNVIPDTLNSRDQVAGLVRRLQQSRAGVFLLLCPPSTTQQLLVAAASQTNWNATFLVPSSLATEGILDAAAALNGRVVFAVSSSSSDYTPEGMAIYRRLAETYGLGSQHMPSQLAALAESRILYETLVRAGRELSREKLVEELEGIYNFQTGFTSPVSFGPNRRVGSDKLVFTRVDRKTRHLQALPQ